jgi:hypothetical protein
MNLEEQEELVKAEKEVEKEYFKEIVKELSNFSCFSGKNLYIYSRKIWNDLINEYLMKPKDLIFDELVRSVIKSQKFLVSSNNPFQAYRYILKVVRVELSKKKDNIDEGESL